MKEINRSFISGEQNARNEKNQAEMKNIRQSVFSEAQDCEDHLGKIVQIMGPEMNSNLDLVTEFKALAERIGRIKGFVS